MSVPERFDVFLSYNRADQAAVEELARRLVAEGLEPWLDTWHLIPGERWQPAIEEALHRCDTCAVHIGPTGIGPWQHEEMRAAIDKRINPPPTTNGGRFRVIPVLLPGARRDERMRLPTFLTAATWVEFRDTLDDPEAFHLLLCGIRGVKPDRHFGDWTYDGQCPYRGLEAFHTEHQAFFFGREALTEWLLEALRRPRGGRDDNRFLAIVGPSGSGKSSLALAGLVAAVRNGKLESSADWPRAIFCPGANPLESLAVALARAGIVDNSVAAIDSLEGELLKEDRTLHRQARLALHGGPVERRLLLVVDQFEEVFTLCPREELRKAFLANLLYAASVAGGKTVAVLTMRADFYGKCAGYETLAAAVAEHQILVGPLTEEELRRAIERPAQLVGCEFEPGLVDMLVQDVRNQAGALPLLQYALLELWKRRKGRKFKVDDYQAIGRLEGALDQRANTILQGFSAIEQEQCRRIFLRLTQPGEGTEDTKRRVSFRELLSADVDVSVLRHVLEKLVDERLLTAEREAEVEQVEVAHEALIRAWSALRHWIETDRAGLRTHRRLGEAAREWETSGKDASFLYRGARLAEFSEWAQNHPNDVNQLERDFVEASLRAQEQQRADELAAARRLADEADRRRQVEQEKAEQERAAAKRLRWAARVLSAVTLAAVGLLAVSLHEWRDAVTQRQEADRQTIHALEERTRADTEKDAADGARRKANDARVDVLTAFGVRLMDDGDELSALPWFVNALEGAAGSPAEQEVHRRRIGEVEARLPRLVGFWGHESPVSVAEFSADGKRIVTGCLDGSVRDYDLSTGKMASPPLKHGFELTECRCSRDGRQIATYGNDGVVCLWDRASGKLLFPPWKPGSSGMIALSPDGRYLLQQAGVNVLVIDTKTGRPAGKKPLHYTPLAKNGNLTRSAFSPDGRLIATSSYDGGARLWDWRTGEQVVAIMRHSSEVWSVTFSPDGRYLATGSLDYHARIWETATGKLRFDLPHKEAISCLRFSPDSRYLAVGSRDGHVGLWKVDTGALKQMLDHKAGVGSIEFGGPGDKLLLSVGGVARLWDVESGRPICTPLRHNGGVSSASFDPSGRYLVTSGQDGAVRVWDLDSRYAPIILLHEKNELAGLAFSVDGRWIATASWDGTARIWDAHTGGPLSEPIVHPNSVYRVAFSPDGKRLLTVCHDHCARVWEIGHTVKLAFEPLSLGVTPASVAYDPRGQVFVTPYGDTDAQIWDAQTGRAIRRVSHGGYVQFVGFSPDGRSLVTCSSDKTARIWDPATGRPIIPPLLHDHQVLQAAFSPDGRLLATASSDNTARVWDATSGMPKTPPLRHKGSVECVAFSPDGRRIVTGSTDNLAKVWDTNTGQPVLPPLRHKGGVTAVQFSKDGRLILTASSDRTARLWDAASGLPVTPLLSHEASVVGAAFNPDGKSVATASQDHTAHIWTLQRDNRPLAELQRLCEVLTGEKLRADGFVEELPAKTLAQMWSAAVPTEAP